MSAAFEIYDDQNEEKSCEYAESLISLREKSESIPLEEREIPIGISFIQEAKLEAFDEIKNKEREENSDFDGECKEQECNKQDEGVVPGPLGGRPRPQGGRMDRNCRESTQRAHCENIEEFSTPKLIQTSRLDENEVDDVLRHSLDLIYMPCSNQAMDMDSDSDVEGIYVPEGPSVEHLKMKMGFRLQEGQGEARYILGLGKNCDFLGLNKKNMYYSLKTLCCVASSLQADTLLLEVQEGPQGKVVQTLIRSTSRDAITSDIKVMLLGDTQSGKSTMVGLLTSNQTDDGNGLLRENVHSHKHEIISGETSSLNFHIVAFENNGNTHSYKNCEESNWQKIVDSGAKVFTFVDVGGHEKHKQKVYSALTSVYPDYILLVVSAAQGVTAVTEHHLKMALLAEIPIVIVVTHRDLVTETQLYDLKLKIESSIKKFSDDHYLVAAESSEDNLILSRTLKQRVVIPMFSVSSVNRTNVNLFKSFFALLPVNNILTSNLNLPSEFHAYSTLIKKNQVILTGIVLKGTIKKHQILLFGPDAKDNFKYVEVVNIRNKGVLVRHACAGQICTIEIKVGKFTQLWLESEQDKIVKGMILVDSKAKPEPSSGFVAEISLIGNQDSPVTFYEGYEPVVVTQSIKQACHLAFDGPEIGEIKNTDNDIMEKENCASKINMQLSSNYSDESRAKSSKTLKTMKGTSNKSMKNQKNGRSPRSFGLSSMNQKSLARKTSPEDSSPSQRKKKNQRFIVIQPGETRLLTFKFKFHPEYLVPGQKMAIDDTCVKCVGTIKRVLHTTITPRT